MRDPPVIRFDEKWGSYEDFIQRKYLSKHLSFKEWNSPHVEDPKMQNLLETLDIVEKNAKE